MVVVLVLAFGHLPRTALVDHQGTIVGYAVGLAGSSDLDARA